MLTPLGAGYSNTNSACACTRSLTCYVNDSHMTRRHVIDTVWVITTTELVACQKCKHLPPLHSMHLKLVFTDLIHRTCEHLHVYMYNNVHVSGQIYLAKAAHVYSKSSSTCSPSHATLHTRLSALLCVATELAIQEASDNTSLPCQSVVTIYVYRRNTCVTAPSAMLESQGKTNCPRRVLFTAFLGAE